MNDEARELLVKAALEGHPQHRGAYHATNFQADCALGILHRAMHEGQPRWHGTLAGALDCDIAMMQRFDLTQDEMLEIVRRNDGTKGYEPHDFLMIARKACLKEPA